MNQFLGASVVVISIGAFFALCAIGSLLLKGREHERRRRHNLQLIQRAVSTFPWFYHQMKGETLVVVARSDYERERMIYESEVKGGVHKLWEDILLFVTPAFTFYKSDFKRRGLMDIGSWEDLRRIYLQALSTATGVTEQEITDLTGGFGMNSGILMKISQETTHLFVPFSSSGKMTYDAQQEYFGKQTLNSATKYLLASISRHAGLL